MKFIRHSLILCILFFSSLLFASTQLSAATKLSQLLTSFTTLQANFSQKTIDNNQAVLQHSHGILMLMRPNHFRWETQKPEHQIVITDGKTVWIYDVDLQQVTKQSTQHSPINPAKLLSGNINELLRKFNISLLLRTASQEVFLLLPKKPNPDFKSIKIIFKENKLTGMQIDNSMGQINIFAFSNIHINAPLSPTLFSFKAPQGVEVLK